MTLTDEALLSRIQTGDEAAFRSVYDQYVGLLQFCLTKLGAKPEERDDVIQETFEKLWSHAASLSGDKSLKAWLIATARNRLIDRARQASRSATRADNAARETNRIDVGEAVLREAEIRTVGDLIASVSKAEGGDVLRQFYIEGKSVKEIAEREGQAVSTITTKLTRLRRRLEDEIRTRIEGLRA